jgi:hypothetical protein
MGKLEMTGSLHSVNQSMAPLRIISEDQNQFENDEAINWKEWQYEKVDNHFLISYYSESNFTMQLQNSCFFIYRSYVKDDIMEYSVYFYCNGRSKFLDLFCTHPDQVISQGEFIGRTTKEDDVLSIVESRIKIIVN